MQMIFLQLHPEMTGLMYSLCLKKRYQMIPAKKNTAGKNTAKKIPARKIPVRKIRPTIPPKQTIVLIPLKRLMRMKPARRLLPIRVIPQFRSSLPREMVMNILQLLLKKRILLS